MQYKTICLIVAAGNGQRLGNNVPKQYLSLNGKPIIRYCTETFLNHPAIDAVCIVYNPEHQEFYNKALGDLNLLPPVSGGKERYESSFLGLQAIAKYNPEKVLIHDAARPFVNNRIITDIINTLDKSGAVIPAIPVEDTIKECEDGKIIRTVSRDKLFRAQTPQGFVYNEILNAQHTVKSPLSLWERVRERVTSVNIKRPSPQPSPSGRGSFFTDDASLFEHLGKEVRIIPGSQNNFKITTKEDLTKAELIMSQYFETRVGMGFDAHKFCEPKMQENNHIMLCGVAVPHDKSLDGHSDADVGLHAAVDAILGALALGDIGTHFPPTDMKWKGADSSIFLAHANKLTKEHGGEIINIDITIICERPKILPHRAKMCETIAKILGIEQNRVSVKATTTEGMGFTGRKEGIAAQAVVSVRVKGIKNG